MRHESAIEAARECAGVVILCSTMLFTQAALAQTLYTIPYISASFNLPPESIGQESWFTAAYSLTVGTFVMPSGRLGDLYGHRMMVQVGFAWFAVTELLAGLLGQYTSSVIGFDIARGLIGIAPAMLLPNAAAILARIFAPGSRAKMISFCIFASTAPNGMVLGGVFSALVARTLHWYWGFYIFAIVLAAVFLATFILVPSCNEIDNRVAAWQNLRNQDDNDEQTPATTSSPMPQQRFFDPLGAIVGVSGLVLFNFAFNQALVVGWQTVYVYVLLIVGIALMAAFVFVEGRVKDPLVPNCVFNLRTTLVLGCVALGWSSFGTYVFYGTRFIQVLRHHSALSSAAQFAPCGISGTVAAFSSVFLLKHISPSWVMLGAMCAFCAGNALIATMPVQQTYWIQFFLAVVITPIGMDMSFPSASIILSDALPAEQQGTAGSLVNTIVNYSIAFGLGLAGTVELQVNRGGTDVERGIRGGLYLGTGLAGLGIVCALSLLLVDAVQHSRDSKTNVQPTPDIEQKKGNEAVTLH